MVKPKDFKRYTGSAISIMSRKYIIKIPTDILSMGNNLSNEIIVEFEEEGDKIYVRIDIFGILILEC